MKANQTHILVRFGCMFQMEQYKSAGLGRVKSMGLRTWVEDLSIPKTGWRTVSLVCPVCRRGFHVKVRSRRRTLYKKYFVAACFLSIALGAIAFTVLTPKGNRLFGFGLAAPFLVLSAWHVVNAVRGRLSPNDVVSHVAGKVHRILDEG